MEYFDLTTPQQNIWNLQKYYEDTAISNLCGAVFYKERRDHVLLQKAIRQFVENQSSMRLHICEDGSPKQYLLDKADVDIPVLEFPSMEAFDQYAEGFAGKALGLLNGNMFRFAVFYVEEKSGILVVLSHFIADAWTFGLLANQLDAAYLNLSAQGTRQLIKADYRDFIYSENEYLTSNRFQKDKSYWEEKYTIPPERSPIKPNLSPSASIQAKRRTSVLPLALEQRLKEYGKTYSVTPAVLFETALIIYLSKINPENQSITIGVPVLNRKNVLEKNIAGMFISTMPLTVSVDTSMSVLDLAKQISKGHMDLFRHQKYPYTEILKFLREKKGFSGHIYDVMVSYQNAKTHTGADTKWYTNGYSEIPLVIHIDNRDEHESHTVHMDYQTEVFEQTEIQYLAGRLEYILTQMLAEHSRLLSEIKWIPDQELTKILFDFNDTCTDYPREKCVHELFEEQARRTLGKTALVFENKSFTYRELDEMSNSLAHFLRKKGIRPNDVVPIIAKRSWHIPVAMLGILKAGSAYMPVDPSYPADRIASMLELSGSKIALLHGYEKNIPAEIIDLDNFDFKSNPSPISNVNTAKDLAYIIFTSGSTGTPKGIAICHQNVVNYCYKDRKNVYGKIIKDSYRSIVSVTNPIFDIFVTETLLPLTNGLCIYFANEKEALRQEGLQKLFENHEIDVIQTTPTKMKSYLSGCKSWEFLRRTKAIILGGETFPVPLYQQLKNCTDAQIFNIYGPAETTVWSTNAEITGSGVAIGRPIANTQIYLLDTDKNPVPIGVPGELYIAGDGVGLGYLNRPELTAERFVPNPFATKENHHGKTMYQTGDLARWRADGELEYLGRIDTQVKIRGLRIELGEIESAMSGFPGILLAAATDGRDENGRQYLTGYYTADENIEEKALRNHLSAKLPKYMIPNYFVHLNAMPMTPSGKTDRRNLPKPDFTMQERAYTPPETETEKHLAFIWEHLLELPRVGREDDFFELGGDSLTAVSLLNEIETEFHVEISIQDIMEKTLLEQLAAYVEQAPALQRIKASHKGKYLLLPQQKAIYAACMKDPDTLVYNMPAKMILPDTIDRERLKQSVTQVFNHHRMLKSCIRAEDSQLYGIYDKDAQIVFEEYQSGEESAFVRPFSLEQAPLMRIGFTADALLFDLHHIIADGDSLNIILRDIADAYDGKPLSSPEIDYSDYADYFLNLDFSEHNQYFRDMLSCNFESLQLPTVRDSKCGGNSEVYEIPENVFFEAQRYARENNLTDTMIFLAAYGILLSKYTGKDEILSSIILQNRIHPEIKDLVGMFVNTLPFCLTVKGSIQKYMSQTKSLLLDLFRYQELPFLEVAEATGLEKAVINTAFIYQGDGQKALTLNGKVLVPQFIETSTAKFDFSVELIPLTHGARMRLEYNQKKYNKALMDRMADSYIQILTQLEKETLEDVSVLSRGEYYKIIEKFNDTYVDYPREKCVHELFMEQSVRTPDKIALVFEDRSFTYRELDEMSNSLAHFLRERGIGSNDVVPIIAKRSWHILVAMLGVLKAGGAYMLVDYQYPAERVLYLVKECHAKLVLVYGYKYENSIELEKIDYFKNTESPKKLNKLDDIFCVIHTSGSTGVPKTSTLTHKNIVHYINYSKEFFQRTSQTLATTTITFDAFIQETLVSLCRKVPVILLDETQITNRTEFEKTVQKYENSFLFQTPTKLQSYIKGSNSKEFLSKIASFVIGGEVFPTELYEEIKHHTPQSRVYNIYGPTETTICATVNKIKDDIDITIGRPIANTQIYLLDADKNPVPIGVPGELYIAGDGVGLGYLNRPELTAERFVPNPFATKENHHGKTMYQTGDLARWRADGELEYLGRIDTQVKIRGLRIELGEIESAMSGFPGILLAAATDGRDENGRQYLTGYYTADENIEEKALRSHLSAKLPKYMIPNYFVHLNAMPMTPSGKTDRRNLPKPDFTMQERTYTAPETEIEKRLAFIWEHLLELPRVGREDDFFELGGDSLTAVSLLNEIETEFHVEISIQDIMEKTLLEQLAAYVEQAPALQRIKASHKGKYLLLPQQKAIYAACMKDPDTLVYNMPAKMILPDTIDRERLKQSVTQVFNHHRMLKSCIRAEDSQFYGIYDKDAQIVFEEYQSGEESAFVRPFSLEQAPLMRIGFTADALLFDLHHIIADGDSLNIILRDIADAYDGKPLSSPEIDYSDYADYFYSLNTEEHKAYFKEMLQCDMEPVVLPETGKASVGGHSKLYQIPEELFTKARQYARKNGLTDTMVFLGAYGILLSRYTGKKDILSSIILQNRIHAETRDLVGMFVNTLPLCLTLQDDTTEYMQKVKQRLLNLFRYQELPFEDILETVGKEKRPAANTAFVYQGDGEKALFLEGKRLIPRPLSTHTAKFDLSMELTPIKEGCLLRLEYCQGKYKEEFIDSLAQSYLHILKQLDKKKLTHISVLSKEMYHRIIEEFNDTYVEYRKDKCIHELFTEQAARTPDKTALIFEDRSFTYRELDEMSNSLAHFLRERGIGSNDVVPIIAKRSWHILVAMLGVLKAGGAYMPIDPNYPEDRIHYMLGSAKSKLVLEYGYLGKLDWETIKLDRFNYGKNTTALENINTPEDPSYVIFTSGSTGNPKGVTICHQNISNYTHNNNNNNVCHHIIQNQYESIVSVTNIVFDIFVTETLLPLVNGLCIYFANDEEVASQEKLSRLLERNKIDVLQTTPTKMRSYILNKSNTEYLQKLKAIILGGEAFPQDLFHTLKSYTDADIYNIYGPAETTVWSTNAEITGSDITIGRPIANTQIYLLDADKNPVPIGVPGELYIAGDGVGLGYLNRPELTAERFVPNPFATKENHHGKTMYQTGDLARWRADGELEYLGRIDTQVKIRGLRIELGEIESAMSGFPGILLAAATDGRDENGRQYLTGYYTADENIEEKALRSHLSAKLPKYMIPNYFVHLNAMPMTPSGKTDRRNLPKPDFTMQERTYTAPKTETERKLCGLLEELLSLEPVGTQDDFFELGGDSLTAMEYMAKSHSMGIDFSLQDIFDNPTVQSLCESLTKGTVPGIQYNASDFEPYQCLLAQNQIEENFIPKKKSLGHVLLTGATGFLGSHVLEQLLRRETGHIYCLIRGESEAKCREKLSNTLQYYFGARYQNEIGTRILPIIGDIEQEGFAGNLPEQIQTIIHTAASVRHYGSYEYFRRVNVEGTCRMIDWAKKAGAKFIHISTLSVSGNSLADNFSVYRSWEEQYFYESSLYIGQPLDNVYIHSKFEAEKAVYDAMLQGLDAKVIRVGNLTNRASDFKFQPNYRENAFLTREKALLEFGLFPDYLMPLYSEFSPVDLTAEGIVKIAQYADRQTVFHLYSNRPVYFDRFLEIIHALGISMKVVNGDEFSRALNQTILNPDREYIYEAFQNDLDEDGRLLYDSRIHIVNDFTVWFLKQIGFEWNATDAEYLTGYINYFRNLGYFKV